jgi:hypothetical protein
VLIDETDEVVTTGGRDVTTGKGEVENAGAPGWVALVTPVTTGPVNGGGIGRATAPATPGGGGMSGTARTCVVFIVRSV